MKLLRDIWLLIRCYPIARARVRADRPEKYPGTVRHMIAYNETRTELVKRGIRDEEQITGAVVMVAVGLAYLFNH
jgi:hypothetical protein